MDAEKLRRQVLNTNLTCGDDHPIVIFARIDLAYNSIWQERYAGAQSLYQKAIDYGKLVFGQNHQEIAEMLQGLDILMGEQGMMGDALTLRQEVLTMRSSIAGSIHLEITDHLLLAFNQA